MSIKLFYNTSAHKWPKSFKMVHLPKTHKLIWSYAKGWRDNISVVEQKIPILPPSLLTDWHKNSQHSLWILHNHLPFLCSKYFSVKLNFHRSLLVYANCYSLMLSCFLSVLLSDMQYLASFQLSTTFCKTSCQRANNWLLSKDVFVCLSWNASFNSPLDLSGLACLCFVHHPWTLR